MLKKLKAFFESTHVEQVSEDEQLRNACAVLLIEISRADGELSEIESDRIKTLLQDTFELDDTALESVFAQGKADEQAATSYFPFIQLINHKYDYEQRVKLVELMWQVASADGVIDAYEDHVIRKLADLLYVSHSDFIKTKLAVIQSQ